MSIPKTLVRKSSNKLLTLADKSGWFGKREPVHFLHIGKNAGTQVHHLARQINKRCPDVRIKLHSHFLALRDLGPGDRYFFSIRDPIARFRSAFYSRKRKGQPLNFIDWSADEALAFGTFEHANDLAEALSDEGEKRAHAFAAIKSIFHTTMNQADWFTHRGYFLQTQPPVYIIRQEHFDADLRAFCRRLVGTDNFDLATNSRVAHRNDYAKTPPLSDLAKTNLSTWYAQDIAFYRHCENWIERQS